MMLKKTIILSILLFFIKSNANDFPTLARSEFVFACMSSTNQIETSWQNVHVQLMKLQKN